jgi:hypothetical protein
MVVNLASALTKERKKNAHLRALLRRYEWASDNQGAPVCPECGGHRDYEAHAPDCELAPALGQVK